MQPRIHLRHLSEAQIRTLLQRKLNAARQTRLERYHRTGRRILLVPDDGEPSISAFHSQPILKISSPNPRLAWLPSFGGWLLLFFEAAAMLGMVLVAGMGWNSLRHTNHYAQEAFAMPALTPTPLIRAVVIPSGHTPPDAAGRTYPNMAEIPLHLRPLVQTYASLPVELPTPAVEQAMRINIPAIDVDAPVVQGDGWEQLKKGVAQHLGTAGPGQNGNMVLSGHNDVYGEVFRYLDRLEPGDEIVVYSARKAYTYVVTGWTLVEPAQVEVMDPTPNATLTLISCYPYLIDNQRIIIKARLADI